MCGYLISQELSFPAFVIGYDPIKQSFEDFYQQIPNLFQEICLFWAFWRDFLDKFGEIVYEKYLFVP